MANERINKLKVMLAEQLGKDEDSIFKWCTNTSQADLNSLIKIAKLLKVEVTDLIKV